MTLAPALYWPHFEELEPFAKERVEQDFEDALKRDKCSRKDFTAGWIAMAMRHKLWSYFNPDIARLLREQYGSSISI